VNDVTLRILKALTPPANAATPSSRFIVKLSPLLRTTYVEMGELLAAADDAVSIMTDLSTAISPSTKHSFGIVIKKRMVSSATRGGGDQSGQSEHPHSWAARPPFLSRSALPSLLFPRFVREERVLYRSSTLLRAARFSAHLRVNKGHTRV